jgi:hypothetical protein
MMVDDQPLTAEDCAIGAVVAGKYLVEGVIGRGSMGVVVRATHLGFDELVALKFIRPEMRRVDGILSRFAREAKASVRIRNEHAVNVLDVGVADPIGPFFVMEYLEGINLEELVDSQGPFDPALAVRYVLEACEGLAAAHAQGIIHRDIKPQNMFLAWQGRLEIIKLLDFGISKAALSGQVFGDDLSMNERDWVMGTPLYMSPEQLRHAPDIDERTDIWSLGAVLYELLCGRPLFSGNTPTEVSQQVFEAGTRPLRVPVPGVPDGLWYIIERCLSRERDQRYANVAELGEALLPFAPPAACLHVERARSLLGLKPIEFLGFDEDIEEIDAEPIDDADEAVLPLTAPARTRRPYWVEIVLPVVACAVIWIAYRQWQLSQGGGERTDDPVQTVALPLSARPECPTPQQGVPVGAGGSTLLDSTTAGRGVEHAVEREGVAGRDVGGRDSMSGDGMGGMANGRGTAGSREGAGAMSGASSAAQRGGSAAAAASASARRAATGAGKGSEEVARRGAGSSDAARSPAAGARSASDDPDAGADAHSAGTRRTSKPKPKVERKLEFRLIDEQPNTGFDLLPEGAPSSAPPAPSH